MEGAYWLAALSSAVASAVFSALESALVRFSRARLRTRITRPGEMALFERAMEKRLRLALMVRTLDAVADVWCVLCLAAATNGTASPLALLKTFGYGLLIVLIFGETVPTRLGRLRAEWLLEHSLRPLLALERGLGPLLSVVASVTSALARLWGVLEETVPEDLSITREIRSVVSEGERHGAIELEQREMIESIIEFPDVTVSEIMTTRTDMVLLHSSASLQEARELAVKTGFSRIPIYEGNRDNVVGVLYVKDLLRCPEEQGLTLRQVMRPPFFIPESKKVSGLLEDFRRSQVHLAIVLDEYGVPVGLVTMQDIIEEIIGELSDEFGRTQRFAILKLSEKEFEADPGIRLDEFNREVGLSLPTDDAYQSLGGFLLAHLGRIPTVGEHFEYGGIRFTILDAEPRRIRRVKIALTGGAKPGRA